MQLAMEIEVPIIKVYVHNIAMVVNIESSMIYWQGREEEDGQ